MEEVVLGKDVLTILGFTGEVRAPLSKLPKGTEESKVKSKVRIDLENGCILWWFLTLVCSGLLIPTISDIKIWDTYIEILFLNAIVHNSNESPLSRFNVAIQYLPENLLTAWYKTIELITLQLLLDEQHRKRAGEGETVFFSE